MQIGEDSFDQKVQLCVVLYANVFMQTEWMDDWPTERESMPRGFEEIIKQIRTVREFMGYWIIIRKLGFEATSP
jgi:hypothetical protein